MIPIEVPVAVILLCAGAAGYLMLRRADPHWVQTTLFLREPLWWILILFGAAFGAFWHFTVAVMQVQNNWFVAQRWSAYPTVWEVSLGIFFLAIGFAAFARLYLLEKRGLLPRG